MFFARRRPTVQAALRDLEHRSPRARVLAAEALAAAEPSQRELAVGALRRCLSDPSPDVRYVATLGLGEHKDPEATPLLLEALGSEPDPLARQAALIALGNIGASEALAEVRAALSDGPPDLRFQAPAVLVQLDPGGAAAPLCLALQDPDAEVRGAAAAALGDLGDAAQADALVPVVADPVPTVAREAALALGRVGDQRGTTVLIDALALSELRVLAAEGLYRAPDERARPALLKALRRWFVPDLLKVWAAGALARLADPAGEEALTRLLRKREPMVKGLAIQLCGELATEGTRAALEAFAATRAGASWSEEVSAALASVG